MMRRSAPLFSTLVSLILSIAAPRAFAAPAAEPKPVDVLVYGGTSAGVAAAVQAARMGKSVVLVEPGKHLGGLTSGGLGWTDLGNPNVVGGISREFYHRLWQHYQTDAAWHGGAAAREAFRNAAGQGVKGMDDERQLMWVFEPHVAEGVFNDLVAEAKVPVAFGERLDLTSGVKKDGARITSVTME